MWIINYIIRNWISLNYIIYIENTTMVKNNDAIIEDLYNNILVIVPATYYVYDIILKSIYYISS